ncbi:MAG: hypothetical protein WKF50_02235 [Nocardioides sp.]
MKLRKRLPSPALTVSVMALLVAMGGTSYAAGMFGTKDIKDNSIRSVDVRDDTLRKKDLRFDPTGPRGPQGPSGAPGPVGPQGPAGEDGTRWLLVNAAGEIEARSGGFEVEAAYPVLENTAPAPGDNSLRANGNVYIDAGEELTDNGIVTTIVLQNSVDQNGDDIMSGRAPTPTPTRSSPVRSPPASVACPAPRARLRGPTRPTTSWSARATATARSPTTPTASGST